MGKGFRKMKRKIRTGAVLRALLVGVSLGVMAVAALWLLAKLTGAQPDFLLYGLMGGGAALVVSLILMLLLVPSEKRLAKRLDKKLELNEKVQTLVAFKNDQSDMAQLQREDTDRILLEAPAKKLRSKYAWLLGILPVLACASMVVTILLPVYGLNGQRPIDNTSWLMDVYTEQKLKDLIEYVATSGMQEPLREGVKAELEDLMTDLKAVNKKAAMKETVVQAIVDIHDLSKGYDTYTSLVAALKGASVESVSQLGAYIGTLDADRITVFMTGDPNTQEKPDGEGEAQKEPALADILLAGEFPDSAADMAQGLRQAVEVAGVDADKAICKALEDFAAALEAVTADTAREDLDGLIADARNTLIRATEQPGIDRGVEKYTINRLLAIFGIPATELPPEILAAFENEIGKPAVKPGDNEENSSNPGGYSKGEFIVGSDDDIYDPKQEKQVPYGEVIRDYLKIMTDSLDGTLSPELEEMITDYFAILLRKTEEAVD